MERGRVPEPADEFTPKELLAKKDARTATEWRTLAPRLSS
jgi:hypothetical protein